MTEGLKCTAACNNITLHYYNKDHDMYIESELSSNLNTRVCMVVCACGKLDG